LRNLACFLGALVLTSAALYAVVPHERPVLDEVLAKSGSCQVLVVGPSYVQMGIHEAEFDAESRRIGLDLKSCVFAQGALQGYEVRHSLELLLSHEWPKLEHLIIDITLGESVRFDQGNWFKPRFVDWHTWESVPWLLSYYERQRGSLTRYAPQLLKHVQHLLMNYLGIGRGLRVLQRTPELVTEADDPALDAPAVRERSGKRNENEIDDYPGLLRRLTREKRALRKARETAPDVWPQQLRALVRRYQRKDPIFLISPILASRALPRGAVSSKRRLVVLDFQDPARYPELYTEDVRGRTHHLKGEGPTHYSRLLARELHAWRKGR
jgi:hypothetical protein